MRNWVFCAAINFRRAGSYVDRILKGAKAGDLPIAQPEKLDLAVNLRAAKAIGLTMPRSVLVQATRVVD
jgi:putative ABC transport system substrate-binding protein